MIYMGCLRDESRTTAPFRSIKSSPVTCQADMLISPGSRKAWLLRSPVCLCWRTSVSRPVPLTSGAGHKRPFDRGLKQEPLCLLSIQWIQLGGGGALKEGDRLHSTRKGAGCGWMQGAQYIHERGRRKRGLRALSTAILPARLCHVPGPSSPPRPTGRGPGPRTPPPLREAYGGQETVENRPEARP